MNQQGKESLTLRIEGFSAQCYVGIREVEKACKQKVVVNIEIPIEHPSGSEAPQIDYDDICASLRKLLELERFGLLEQLAARIAQMLRDDFGASRYKVRCAKPRIHSDVEGIEVVCARE